MYMGKSVLAVVTARGGSKGLPGKNIKEMCGKPLICWTLSALKDSMYVDRVFISTDYKSIAEVCENEGFAVDELRPSSLAQDNTSSIEVLEYTIKKLADKGEEYDYVLVLEPTSPLRKHNDIDNIIKLAVENDDSDGVISVGKVHLEHPSIIKRINGQGRLCQYSEYIQQTCRRQDEDDAFFPYGVGYLIKSKVLLEKRVIYTDSILPFYIERWQNYEIDDIYDFLCVECIMKEKLL